MEKERIKALRLARGWTWEQMAQELGVTWRTIARWERGESNPSEMARRFLVDLEVKAGLMPSEEEIVGRIFRELKENLEAHAGPWEEGELRTLAERIYWLARGKEVIERIFRELGRSFLAHPGPLEEKEIQALTERVYELAREEKR